VTNKTYTQQQPGINELFHRTLDVLEKSDRVIIDVGNDTFAHGQMHVALSRCTTLEGIVLKKPALKRHIWTNYQVMDFLTKYQYQKAEMANPVD
jgi:ATP-dependent DNA helicase PIF1